MAGPGLTAQPLDRTGAFNWIYLIGCIVDGIICLAFLFYFNRLFATSVSYVIRLVAWHKYKVYVDIQALQISPLAGRIFFKGIRYHGENVTVFIHNGYITWRYWFPRVKECQIFSEGTGQGLAGDRNGNQIGHEKSKELPCRISVKVTGVEGFLYNRGPAYDAVIDLINKTNSQNKDFDEKDFDEKNADGAERVYTSSPSDVPALKEQPGLRGPPHTGSDRSTSPPAPPAFLRLLPIRVEAKTGAVVLGNSNTKSVITAKFDTASGEFDASKSGPLDIFKILMGFNIEHPYIQMKPNVDYKQPQLQEAEQVQARMEADGLDLDGLSKISPDNHKRTWTEKLFQLHKPHKIFNWPNGSTASLAGRHGKSTNGRHSSLLPSPPPSRSLWVGLSRYLDESGDEHQEWDAIEYAKSSVLADIKSLGFKFFWDIPGVVPSSAMDTNACEINGAIPPEYGMELCVRGGIVNYGPWADRHRVNLQQIFFPASFADAIPTTVLKVGQERVATVFALKVIVEEDVTLRLPFREASKDWKWKGKASTIARRNKSNAQARPHGRRRRGTLLHRKRANATSGTEIRPFAWFDIVVKSNSVVGYDSDMLARRAGFKNTLSVDVSALNIYSSLNHALLWRSQKVAITADLSNPLQWNASRRWDFDISIYGLEFFLLRDHTFLLMDLIQDWSSGPPLEFLTFIPVSYLMNVHFHDFQMFLNTNDANIINNSEDIEDNEFVILYGRLIDAELGIPMDQFRPVSKDITFDVDARDLGFRLCMPPRNTLNTFVMNKDVAQLDNVLLYGVYTACSEVAPGLVDTLRMEITGRSFTIDFFGFLARHLIKLKENYFGDNVHFTTVEEYHDLTELRLAGTVIEGPHPVANGLDVILDICAEDVNINLPANLYKAEEFVKIHVDKTDVDLRVNDHYLELMVNSTPLEFSYRTRLMASDTGLTSDTQLFLDGVKVFGHRFFGSATGNPAYVSSWDIDAGSIKGECDIDFLERLIAAGQALALTMNDAENTQPLAFTAPAVPESVFVRFLCPLIKIWCRIDQHALNISTGMIQGTFSDWATAIFSQRLSMAIPDLTLACIDYVGVSERSYKNRQLAPTHAYFETSVTLEMIQRNLHFADQRKIQRDHILTHDLGSQRAPFLVPDRSPLADRNARDPGSDIPSLPLPMLPEPVTQSSTYRQLSHSQSLGEHTNMNHHDNIKNATGHGKTLESTAADEAAAHMTTSSVFSSPNFPLQAIKLDLTDVPSLHTRHDDQNDLDNPEEDLAFEEEYEDAMHTTIIIRAEPGISLFCTPEAVSMAAVVLDRMNPRYPETLLDRFQLAIASEISTSHSKKNGTNTVLDLRVTVPHLHVRFINESKEVASQQENPPSDRYNMITNDAVVTLRIKSMPQRQDEHDATCVHAKMGYMAVSAQEGTDTNDTEDAALQLVIDNVLLWLVDSDRTSVQASVQNTKIAMASRKVEYLAKLIHRTTILVDTFQNMFANIMVQPNQRLQYLVYHLVRFGQGMPDPAFLTRPSYAIRSNADHIRNSDSWKVISRLRHIFQSISEADAKQIITECRGDDIQVPSDAANFALDAFNYWRNWDAMMVDDNFAVHILYGSIATPDVDDRKELPLGLVIRLRRFKLIIDPGPKPNKFSIHDLALRLAIKPPTPPSATSVFHDYDEKRSTVLHIHMSKLKLNINWKICQLIDHTLKLFENQAPGQHPTPPVDDDIKPDLTGMIHIVFASDVSKMRLRTIHLQHTMAANSLRLSVTGEGWVAGVEATSINAILAATNAYAEMHGHQRLLWRADVTAPDVWLDYTRTLVQDKWSESLKMAMNSQTLTFQVKDDILGLLEIVNSVIGDEAAYIFHLAQIHGGASTQISGAPTKLRESYPLHLELALFLNTYRVNIAFLHDVHYSAHGRVARLFVSPDDQLHSTYRIGFDLKSQTHRISSMGLERNEIVSEMELPPINGAIKALYADQMATVSATIIIEKIQVDASAIYGILSIIGTTSVTTAIESIQEDVTTLQSNILKTFPTTPVAKTAKPVEILRPVIFDANLILAGVSILATTSSASDASILSEALFNIDSIYVRAANRSAKDDAPLPFPEMRIALQEIRVQLQSQSDGHVRNSGEVAIGAFFSCAVERDASSVVHRSFHLSISGPVVEIFAESAPTAARILSHLQSKLKGLNLSLEKKYLKRLRHLDRSTDSRHGTMPVVEDAQEPEDGNSNMLSSFAFDLERLRISYSIRDSVQSPVSYDEEDLVLTLQAMNLLARSEEEARLSINNLQLAFEPVKESVIGRPNNSALLPEVVFNVKHKATKSERKLAFHAAGKGFDIQLEPQFMLPVSDLERSITATIQSARLAAMDLELSAATTSMPTQNLFGAKRLASLLFSADFAGAVVRLQSKDKESRRRSSIVALGLDHIPQHGRYGQFAGEDATTNATLRAPGVAFRIQYKEPTTEKPTLNVEVRVEASNNIIYPAVVPLILQISESVKQIVRDPEPTVAITEPPNPAPQQKFIGEDVIVAGDPSAILGKTRLNMGLQICRQEFSLSCQPIAKVAASASIEDIYVTINSVKSSDNETFLAASLALKKFNASLRHVYSREGTFSFGIDSAIVSIMNSKHFSGIGGISAILKIDPSRAQVNAKQLQDLLLFREIWLPPEVRNASQSPETTTITEPQDYFVQRYKKIAETTAFPWHATVELTELALDLDLGQAIGKSSFAIRNLWASSKKTTSSQQNLCIGVDEISMRGTGRLSGLVGLEKVKIRTSIAWPPAEKERQERTPLIQASIGFEHLQARVAFDYQAFAVTDITRFQFIMYNVRDQQYAGKDRLVAILDGDAIKAYCIAASAAFGVSLYQAIERLIQERAASYEQSLKEIEKFLRRRTSTVPSITPSVKAHTALVQTVDEAATDEEVVPHSLHTDVVVTLRALDVGVFPSTLMDNQILKADAYDVEARFASTLHDEKTQSGLGMTLGQLRVSLATVPSNVVPKTLGEIAIDEVLANAAAARGGVILRVPKVLATMQIWQALGTTMIDYIFKSRFEGKIDIGWNYSRISFIRGMWATHMRTLASKVGKPLPVSAVKIHGAPEPNEEPMGGTAGGERTSAEQQKITAVVNLPQSKYTYTALEPPVIDTPQLRDMGEATPPLEWIGVQKDKLPHVTHQIVIVSLLRIAKEVEDAYSSILGSA